ncbi:hypothetical protein DLJ49_13765 [Rhodovulum sp. 12E13]|uniref:hypothetical protein n=1 Tax=Rhodovulum sp. 12E13 TaxID=2203891 RepID=UPI000E136E5D|nr:hypothetical protein [Rhodovulum sp. 12E13]RDC71703.1 hypothetical protein DLJ49_13765 [Rhodovulum sp. 12E13]
MERPVLTFPDEVAERVRAEYARASVVLEYGSGGSTALAAETPGLTCFSVENDLAWARAMAAWLAAHHPAADVRLHRAWIGPTKTWGRPRWPRLPLLYPLFRRYPAAVWARRDFRAPDLILVDGRFRVACFLTALMHVRRPTRLLWDDYTRRPDYHVVERYCAPVSVVGRMAVFDITPTGFSPAELERLRAAMLDPE